MNGGLKKVFYNKTLFIGMEGLIMTQTWELQEGKVKVVEDANTASLVIVARDHKSKKEKITALEEVISKMRSSLE